MAEDEGEGQRSRDVPLVRERPYECMTRDAFDRYLKCNCQCHFNSDHSRAAVFLEVADGLAQAAERVHRLVDLLQRLGTGAPGDIRDLMASLTAIEMARASFMRVGKKPCGHVAGGSAWVDDEVING